VRRHRDEPDVAGSGPLPGQHESAAEQALGDRPMSPERLIALQRSAGNAAVARLVSTGEPVTNEPPASTPTSATSPLEVEPQIADDETEDAELPAPVAPPPAPVALPDLPVAVPETEGPGSGSGSAAPPPGPALPPAGASRDDVMDALRAANGTMKRSPDWLRLIGRFPSGSDDARLATNLLFFGPEARWPAPLAVRLIPFDTAPLSAPNERIIFNLLWNPSAGAVFHEIVLTASDGTFVAAGSKTTTITGLITDNLDFRLPARWSGTAITVKAEVRPRGSAVVLTSQTWTFNKKAVFPTTMAQTEGEGERPLPSDYLYSLGPAIRGKRPPFYGHQTILETFPGGDCNIQPSELTDAFKAAHPDLTDSKKINTYFFGDSGANGTFTVGPDDKIKDQHGGIKSGKPEIEPHLKTWKEIHNDTFQVYEAEPGRPLAKYTIRRIVKVDGSGALRKFKTP
jgi:hypothetical protein